ncbi:ATP-binding protein [Acinetobacter sp. WCHAc060033]|uniref:AAA family ATPase n=1 Tax=Acinetobacter sp. WCHAc060033 TaxID=2518624 RepID=UPI0010237E4D|nr:ATP-binding protein [Acinetobacter sp. WCHAc060033]RZG81502.1 ATP-binding protein [Acinetobacter sp. WCHAc060033]
MQHYSIVVAICRAALQVENPAISGHIERLIKALEKDEEVDQVAGLKKLLQAKKKNIEILPSRVVLSSNALTGEQLIPTVKAPVDRETSASLAEIIFPNANPIILPIFESGLASSINNILDEWKHVDKLKSKGIDPALSLMLFGAPGTGKTLLAHHIGETLGLPIIVARLDGLLSSFLGTTARNIANLFAFANRYKCILLLDEFDAIAKLRDDPNELGELKRVVNTLLQCLDERSKIGFTIAITNHELLLDSAIWRRFDLRIEIPKPVALARRTMLQNHFNDLIKITEVQLDFLVWLSKGYSGSDIEKLAFFIQRKIAILDKDFHFLETIKEYLRLNANTNSNDRKQKVLSSPEELAQVLNHDTELSFSQMKIAQLFGVTQPKISKMLNSSKEVVALEG